MAKDRLSKRILEHLSREEYRPQESRSLAESLGVSEDAYADFRATVKALMKEGHVVMGSASALTLPDPGPTVTGDFRRHERGFGFVIPDTPNSHGDLFVPPKDAGDAVTGDRVVAKVLKRGKRDGRMMYEGRITQIIQRGENRFVGELCKDGNRWYVAPDGRTFRAPIFVGDPGAKGTKPGNKVVVEIVEYPTEHKGARGVILKVLGKSGEPGVDTRSIIEQYRFREDFPQAVLDEASAVTAAYHPQEVARQREDLRDVMVITIDPDDARDFDDAISIKALPDGGYELGVHIADVSFFVEEGSALDDEAKTRSTSVYFPRYVIPMLPEVLSNGLCSLQERQPRLTKSAIITYDARGNRQSSRLINSIIQSNKRLTYKQATAILDGKAGRFSPKVVTLLREMDKLARLIQKRRLAAGALVLDLPEVELILNDNGLPTSVEPADQSFSHTIIEMFMVEANEVVAECFAAAGVPSLRRVHPAPDAGALEPLNRFLRAVGIGPVASMDRAELQAVLKRVHGQAKSYAVNLAVLRSMEQAKYEPILEGHFALASEHYCHFTSPIRRYPDLTIHRLFNAHVAGKLGKGDTVPDLATVEELGEHCSKQERQAEAAERELRKVLLLRMLAGRVGEEFAGVVTGVANIGVFVQLQDFLVEGLVRFQDMTDDWWEVDTRAGCVVGLRSGKKITTGDALQVIIARIDIPTREMDLAFPGAPRSGRRSEVRVSKRQEGRKASPDAKRGKRKLTSQRPRKPGPAPPKKHPRRKKRR
jgi:ribonuclease R